MIDTVNMEMSCIDSAQEEQTDFSNLLTENNNNNIRQNIAVVKSKLLEFSNYLLGPGRLPLMHANRFECEELIFIIQNMKKQFKHILTELGKCSGRKDYSFCCSVCDEKLSVPLANFWEFLQDHEHVENNYHRFLMEGILSEQETLDSSSAEIEKLPLTVGDSHATDKNNDDNDSSVEINNYGINEVEISDDGFDESNVNSYRFNFVPSYDKVVQSKLYPEKTIQSLKKYDKTDYPTILAIGPSRFVCLLCSCDLLSRSKIRMSKHFFLDHIVGNRHMKQATLIENVNAVINFHETWLSKEPLFQAHQVYFRPFRDNILWCILCDLCIASTKVDVHILADVHRHNVLGTFYKNINSFYLLDLQVQLYGVLPEPKVEDKHTPIASPVKEKERNKRDKIRKDSKSKKPSNGQDQVDESPHNIIKSVENPSSKVISELLPNRFKNHSQYFIKLEKEKMIRCKICCVRLSNDLLKLISHICDKHHLELSKVPLIAYNYYCEVCNLKIIDEFAWSKHFEDAPKLHARVPESRKSQMAEYECTKCSTVIFGDALSLSRHLATKRVRRKSTEIKLASSVLKLFKSRNTIESEAQRLVSEANEMLENNGPTLECCYSLEQLLPTGCKAYPFGSRISGLGNQKSDLDIFLDIGDMYAGDEFQDSLSQIQIVKKVHNVMIKAKEEFQDVIQIPTARTPIVKFHHRKTEIDCDVSFRHGLSVENTKFLRFCFDLQAVSQPFILVLKMWSHHNGLSEHITTYALAIMAIFYLQTKGYLLSVKQVRQLNQGGLIISCWETIEYTVPIEEMKKHVITYSGSLVELLKEFFLYYSKFVYTVDVMCPLLGCCVKKKHFNDNGKVLPPEMQSYRTQLQSKESEPFRNASPMCIQDPFDLSHNLTKALQLGTLNKFRMLCEMSYKHIDTLL